MAMTTFSYVSTVLTQVNITKPCFNRGTFYWGLRFMSGFRCRVADIAIKAFFIVNHFSTWRVDYLPFQQPPWTCKASDLKYCVSPLTFHLPLSSHSLAQGVGTNISIGNIVKIHEKHAELYKHIFARNIKKVF
jgi:hypothetical protein